MPKCYFACTTVIASGLLLLFDFFQTIKTGLYLRPQTYGFAIFFDRFRSLPVGNGLFINQLDPIGKRIFQVFDRFEPLLIALILIPGRFKQTFKMRLLFDIGIASRFVDIVQVFNRLSGFPNPAIE